MSEQGIIETPEGYQVGPRFTSDLTTARDYAAEDLAQREADDDQRDRAEEAYNGALLADPDPNMTDADALDRLAAFMNRPGPWNGGDVCELAAELLAATGRQMLDNGDDDGQVCKRCEDEVYTLSSDGLCDGCVEVQSVEAAWGPSTIAKS